MAATPVRAAIEIHVGVRPISGHIGIDGAAPLPFSGWLELTAALAAAARGDLLGHPGAPAAPTRPGDPRPQGESR